MSFCVKKTESELHLQEQYLPVLGVHLVNYVNISYRFPINWSGEGDDHYPNKVSLSCCVELRVYSILLIPIYFFAILGP